MFINVLMSDMKKYLDSGKAEEDDADVSVRVVSHSRRFTSEFKACSPSSNSNNVCRALTSNMQIKPCRICKDLQISCCDGSNWHQDTPTDSTQHSMGLKRGKNHICMNNSKQ